MKKVPFILRAYVVRDSEYSSGRKSPLGLGAFFFDISQRLTRTRHTATRHTHILVGEHIHRRRDTFVLHPTRRARNATTSEAPLCPHLLAGLSLGHRGLYPIAV